MSRRGSFSTVLATLGLLVWAFAPGAGEALATPPVAPTVDDQPAFASSVSQFAATLNGTINPGGLPTDYHFLYGPTSAYGSVAPVPDLYTPINSEDDRVAQHLSGLQPGTTYHFALLASNAAQTGVTGPDETFTTLAVPPPLASAGTASGVTQGAATLAGTVDTRGWDTTYRFDYGTTAEYGQRWPTIDTDMGALTGSQPVSVYVENLQPSTTYHFRLVATDAGGSQAGPDQTFTTTGYPPSIIQEPQLGGPVEPTVSIAKAVFRRGSLLVTVETSHSGTVKLSGSGLKATIAKNVPAGRHQFSVGLTKLGRRLAKAHRMTSMEATLTSGQQSANETLNVKL
jgi:hypothetical protein